MPAEGLPDSARLDSGENWRWLSSRWITNDLVMDREIREHLDGSAMKKVTIRHWMHQERDSTDGVYEIAKHEFFTHYPNMVDIGSMEYPETVIEELERYRDLDRRGLVGVDTDQVFNQGVAAGQKSTEAPDMDGGCHRAGPGGDCSNYIGLPGKSIPDQHDGEDDTVDYMGKPNGWCWSCWQSKQMETLQAKLVWAQEYTRLDGDSNEPRPVSVIIAERKHWKEEARRYAQNSDHHRAKREFAEEGLQRLMKAVGDENGDLPEEVVELLQAYNDVTKP